ncbi:putative dUTP diphosphatase [Erwinia phage phiEa2809]|uniref:Putative dUTP diphosphatase n=1 Tax=Erwinia phage phiEa2809 TaxID=1564096 RepID=A0A0A0YR26_9CAUD|nr:putative dUTP diphosphatase [Erwinia phage phiEa2809]AIX13047.1 putative dUTP diphosphatase [Erwinia phage phiEa2809]
MTQLPMLNRKQFLDLLELQVQTNQLYGVEWNDNSIRCSIYREFAEFLDEVESHWHCYKQTPSYNRTDAVYELVDISHFMLCQMLLHRSPQELSIDPNFPVRSLVLSHMEHVEYMFTEFMHKPTPWNFSHFLYRACAMLGITTEQYLVAHYKKNARNQQRARGGVTEGKYDKAAETPLTLEL